MKKNIFIFLTVFIVYAKSLDIKNIKTIKADFIQSINSDNKTIKYRGIVYANSDFMAYWRYDSPIKKEIYINKNKIIIYEIDTKQAIISNDVKIDFIKLLENAKEQGGELISIINNIQFNITIKDEKPYIIEYIDELDNKISITLNNVTINKQINKDIFNPKLPKDIEIIFDNK